MRSDYLRIYKSVHTWTGILAGMALFIAFYAGALTIFKDALARWSSAPSAVYGQALALERAPELIVRTLQAQPAAGKDFRLHLAAAEHLPGGLSWQVRPDGEDEHEAGSARHYVATLESTGSVQVTQVAPSGLVSFIDRLHRVAGLPDDKDEYRWVMGVVAVLYALALISGVIVLLPSLVKDFFALRIGKNLKRMWLDAHNVVGIASLPFHLVMALTAIVFAYHDGFYVIQNKLIHAPRPAAARPASTAAPVRDPAQMLTPVQLLARVKTLSPDFEPSSLQYLQVSSARAAVRVWGHDPAAHAPRFTGGFVALDPYTGKVLSADFLPGRQSNAYALIGSFFALHFGTYGGLPVRWLYFLLGLAGAWLFYSGNLLWVESRRKKTAPQGADAGTAAPVQRRDVRLLAASTVGICVGTVLAISLIIVASKCLSLPHGWYPWMYYLVLLAALGWSCWRGAARAAIHLLWLAALATLAIPASSLLGWAWPALGLWGHTSSAALGVDGTALLGALGLIWMARATTRRALHGPADSVWAIR
ncbi:PepSY-associated TM helix domain-containing protein [Pseudoduganella danionis]|uniref:PepSY-associated TM helix domain-containing protein n=1 Tax=Pseudoduganella danionis TaxID=1890295 RepID=UPI0035AEA554